mgnify:CR=1 FL=1
MSEKPILFSGEMVRAILEGRKTMTRRVVKPQPEQDTDCPYHVGAGIERKARICPYGKPGDRLWVKETMWECIDNNDKVRYVADGPIPIVGNRRYKKKPSLFMSRSESRLTLEVVNVRVERVQDITEGDAEKEGTTPYTAPAELPAYKPAFADLWDRINEKRGFGWDKNPWVWVIEFKPLTLNK